MSYISEILYLSEKNVRALGKAKLSSGQTVSQSLKFDGISYWDVFSSEFASRYFPSAFKKKNLLEFIFLIIKINLIKLKHFLKNTWYESFYKKKFKEKIISSDRILCLEFTDQQSRDVMQPVIRYLVDKKKQKVLSLNDKNLNNLVENNNSNELYFSLSDFWNKKFKRKYLFFKLKSELVNKSFYQSKVLDLYFTGSKLALKRGIRLVLDRFFNADILHLLRQGIIARNLLEKYRPSIIIVTDIHDPRVRIFLILCKQLGIPSLAIQHGLINSLGTEWRFFLADKVAVWGKHFTKVLISHGISSDKISITGPPRTDFFCNFNNAEINHLKNKYCIPKNCRIILLASTFALKSYDGLSSDIQVLSEMKKVIIDSVKKLNNVFLLIKLHPHEQISEIKLIKQIASGYKNIILIDKSEDIRYLTIMCDCFISFNSTTTIDALLLKKLVICPSFPGWSWNDTFKKTKAVLSPSTADEIKEIFSHLSRANHYELTKKLMNKRNKLIHSWVYRFDGRSAKRIGDLALKMCNK